MNSYISSIRNKIGNQKFIVPDARIIIENDKGEFLFITRKDNRQLSLPAGSLEENETIEDCIKREVKEETGLALIELVAIGISSNPKNETVTYTNGDVVQYFTVEFYSNQFQGEIVVNNTKEIITANFYQKEKIEMLPKNERRTFESLEFFRNKNQIKLG